MTAADVDLDALYAHAEAAAEWFWSKVVKGPYCWEWQGNTKPYGYGSFSIKNRTYRAHRIAYMLEHGSIPPGLVIDHTCRNTKCVRPDHLRAVTQRVNVMAGETIPALEAAKTECIHGHPLSGDNLHIRPDGSRQCLTCRAEHNRRANRNRPKRTCELCGAQVFVIPRHLRQMHSEER
jgi:hypothetical protein